MKVIVAGLLLTMAAFDAYSQACDCPAAASCSACSGGLNSVAVEFTGGGVVILITASDDGGGLPVLGLLGNSVQINSRDGQPFDGDVTVNVTGIPGGSVTFPTSCSAPVYHGTDLGDFIILEGTSMSGPICCSPPVINGCPSNISVSSNPALCGASVSWTAPTADPGDDCTEITSFTSNFTPGAFFPVGAPTTVTYVATNDAGATANCSFTVTVVDDTDPVITSCQGNVTRSLNGSCNYVIENFIGFITATDNCSSAGNIVYTQSPVAGTTLGGVGSVNTVTLTATDQAGNAASCTFDITLQDASGPTITSCQGNVTRGLGAGCSYVVENFTPFITATDNCSIAGNIVYTQSPTAGTLLGGVGAVHTITLTARDQSNNTTSCTFDITLQDAIAPVITSCPVDGSRSLSSACNYTLENFLPGFAATDNCSPAVNIIYTQSPVAGTILSGVNSIHTITMTATDQSGNATSCDFDITLQDTTVPVITSCQGNVTRSLNASCAYPLENFTGSITATDNCSLAGNIVYTQSPVAGTILSGASSVHTITLTALDQSNNSASCTFDITLQDVTAPQITSCQGNVTRSLNASCAYPLENFTGSITATDNCSLTGNIVYTQSPIAGTILSGVGSVHTITLTATDQSNNTTNCTFNITLQDNTAPLITSCQGNVSKSVGPINCTYTLENFTGFITATDNCSPGANIVYTQSPAVGTNLSGAGSVHTITLTARDQSNNTASCTFDINLQDTTVPVITFCPPNISLIAPLGSCTAIATWSPPGATDNCGAVTWTSTHTSGTAFAAGVTPVTFTARDGSNNTATCNFTVTVVDNENPVFTCNHPPIQVIADGNCEAVATWTPPVATDNCSAIVTSTHNPGATFQPGPTQVIYTATDPSGNTATCQFNVIVKDETAPVITACPSNITVFASATSCQAVASWTPPGATDNCATTMTFDSNFDPGDTFPLGITTITYTAEDGSNNISLPCSFTVTVIDDVDPVIPVISDITVSASGTSCNATVSWTAPLATDNCSVSSLNSDIASGTLFNVGVTAVTYTATDGSGNTSTRAFNVNVVEDTDPVIPVIPDITVFSSSSSCDAVVSWSPPAATDNCAILSLTSDIPSGSSFNVGATPVTYTATDVNGNTFERSFNINVIDNTGPLMTGCPSNITVFADANCQAVASWTPPGATDNCSTTMTFDSNFDPGDTFALGVTTVTYTAEDTNANVSLPCSFTVTVIDDIDPAIPAIPDITVSSGSASCEAVVSWTAPVATDNCSVLSLNSDIASGTAFNVGTTTVTYTATDVSGNIGTRVFNVNIVDDTDPVIPVIPDITVPSGSSSCNTTVSWTAPVATDNCGLLSLSSDIASGTSFDVGTTPVTYTATDINGNTSERSFNIVVTDDTDPVITDCPSNITVPGNANCHAVVSWTPPIASDNCIVALTSSHNPGSTFATGSTTTVTYTATDAAGNTTTCVFTVTVSDEIAPVITGNPSSDIVAAAAGSCQAQVSWSALAATDCGTAVLTSSHASGSNFPVGITEVVCTATDDTGNVSTCKFNVVVQDKTAPMFSNCLTEVTATANASCSADVTWNAPAVSDDCGVSSITKSHNPGETFSIGTTEVIYTATDIYGNVSFCKFNVIVKNEHLPLISGCPEDIIVKADESGKVTAEWTPPTASAQCGEVTLTGSHDPGDTFSLGTTEVEYTATDDSGKTAYCKFNVMVSYEDLEFSIGKVITPDGDGINDQWVLPNIEKFKDNTVIVVDRWGSLIYSASGYNNENVIWRGVNSSGVVVPTGTYFYTIKVKFVDKVVEKRGFVELIQ